MEAIENNANSSEAKSVGDADLDQIKRRSFRYWFEDGLGELVVGCLFILIGMFTLVEGLTPPGAALRRISGVIALLVIAIGPWIGRPILRTLKQRLTYPRTGYVSYRKTKLSRRRRILSYVITLVTIGIVVGVISISPEETLAWIPLLEGVIIGGLMLFQGYVSGLNRFYGLGVFTVLLGAGLSVAGIGDLVGMGLFFAIAGLVITISGGLTLIIYLRQYQTVLGGIDER